MELLVLEVQRWRRVGITSDLEWWVICNIERGSVENPFLSDFTLGRGGGGHQLFLPSFWSVDFLGL